MPSFIIRSINVHSPTKLMMSVEINGGAAQNMLIPRAEFTRNFGLDERALAIFRMRSAWLEAGSPSGIADIRTALLNKVMEV
jgi:hypothetical protein